MPVEVEEDVGSTGADVVCSVVSLVPKQLLKGLEKAGQECVLTCTYSIWTLTLGI